MQTTQSIAQPLASREQLPPRYPDLRVHPKRSRLFLIDSDGFIFRAYHARARSAATNYFSSIVSKLRASDGGYVGTYVVGSGPAGVAFDGANMWVANSGSGTVSKL